MEFIFIIIILLVLTLGCTDLATGETIEFEGLFKDSFKEKPIYVCDPDCDEEKMEKLQLDCEDSVIIVETSSATYRRTLSNQGDNCRYDFFIERSSSSRSEGLALYCDIPMSKTGVLVDQSLGYMSRLLKYCSGSYKEFYNSPSQWLG